MSGKIVEPAVISAPEVVNFGVTAFRLTNGDKGNVLTIDDEAARAFTAIEREFCSLQRLNQKHLRSLKFRYLRLQVAQLRDAALLFLLQIPDKAIAKHKKVTGIKH
jgi:hypothetical protein